MTASAACCSACSLMLRFLEFTLALSRKDRLVMLLATTRLGAALLLSVSLLSYTVSPAHAADPDAPFSRARQAGGPTSSIQG